MSTTCFFSKIINNSNLIKKNLNLFLMNKKNKSESYLYPKINILKIKHYEEIMVHIRIYIFLNANN